MNQDARKPRKSLFRQHFMLLFLVLALSVSLSHESKAFTLTAPSFLKSNPLESLTSKLPSPLQKGADRIITSATKGITDRAVAFADNATGGAVTSALNLAGNVGKTITNVQNTVSTVRNIASDPGGFVKSTVLKAGGNIGNQLLSSFTGGSGSGRPASPVSTAFSVAQTGFSNFGGPTSGGSSGGSTASPLGGASTQQFTTPESAAVAAGAIAGITPRSLNASGGSAFTAATFGNLGAAGPGMGTPGTGGAPFSTRATGRSSGPPKSCDPKYMNSLKSRAWLEAEREIIQNQNLIFKADSVLEYTCFSNFVGHTAKNAGNLFVHTTAFGSIPINPRMEQALSNSVGSSLQSYLQANFKHTFLGDRADLDFAYAGINPQNYTCDKMNMVWKAAKCRNFLETELERSTDGFFTFEEMSVIPDPRGFPRTSPCGGPGGAAWKESIEIASNKNNIVYPYKDPLVQTYTKTGLFLAAGDCQQPIVTGVSVRGSKFYTSEEGYPDAVCTNPGCSYVARATGLGTCEKPKSK